MRIPSFSRLASAAILSAFALLAPGTAPRAIAQGIYFGQPANSRVTVWNNYGSTINVYAVDRWGGWRFGEAIGKGNTASFASPAGQIWNVADKKGKVLKQFRAQPGRMTVAVEREKGEAELTVRSGRPNRPVYPGPGYGTGPAYERSELAIKNKTDSLLLAYEVSRWGSWEYRFSILPGKTAETRAAENSQWMVTTRRGKPLKEFRMRDRDTKVEIKD